MPTTTKQKKCQHTYVEVPKPRTNADQRKIISWNRGWRLKCSKCGVRARN